MVVMLARYMSMVGNVQFRLVCGQYRDDWEQLDEGALERLFADYELIGRALVGDAEATANIAGRNHYRVYPHALLALNPVLARHDAAFIDRFLLKAQDFEGYAYGMPIDQYICWHVRHNDKWGTERNLTDAESMEIAKYLRWRFHDKKIMVVSDSVGCNRYKKLFPEFLFSKDYSDSFMGDCELVLSADFYFAQRAGGMSVVPMFSKLPYEIRANRGYLCLNGTKPSSWATDEQCYYDEPSTLPQILEKDDQCLLQT